MSLREPVELLDPSAVGPVYFIAIGGAGMSGVARIYHDLGVEVRGSDQVDSANLRDLASLGVQTWVGHDPSHLVGARTVVVSSGEERRQMRFRSATVATIDDARYSGRLSALRGSSTSPGIRLGAGTCQQKPHC